jgi:hypothetical protein
VLNWSFENHLEAWGDSTVNGLAATARHDIGGGEAASGRFAGMIQGSSASSTETVLLGTPLIEAVPGRTYTLSFLVRSDGDITGNALPAVRRWKSRDTVGSTVLGTETTYRELAYVKTGSYTLSWWSLYHMAFTIPAGRSFMSVHLWRSTSSGTGGTVYFDDVVLEEGNLDEDAVTARRAQHGYSASWSDAFGRTHQTQTPAPENTSFRRVEGVLYDSAGRLHRTPLPVGLQLPSPSPFVTDILSEANSQHDAGGYAYGEVLYANEPSSRVIRRAAPGEAWRLGGTKTAEAGFYFRGDLSVPGNIINPAMDNHERDFRLDWARDPDSAFTLTWTNRKGQVVQSARQAGPTVFALTRTEYYPAGRIRKILSPLDVESEGEAFAEIQNHNAQRLLTSRHTRDRGLEKFWYNRAGQPRFSQDDRQREESASLFTYFDYDDFGNLVSTGEQIVYYPDQESVVDGNGGSYPYGKTGSSPGI